MKRLSLLALPLLLAACGGNGFPTGASFSASAGGTGAAVGYHYIYTENEGVREYVGTVLDPIQQANITTTVHAGSVGASITTASIQIVDQNSQPLDLGKLPDGAAVSNPYVQSFPARLMPGWACLVLDEAGNPTTQVDAEKDPGTCAANQRVGYTRIEYYPNTAGPIQNPEGTDPPPIPDLISQNVASRLAQIAAQSDKTFNGAMIVTFSGIDDNRRPVSFKSERIALNVYRSPDQAQ